MCLPEEPVGGGAGAGPVWRGLTCQAEDPTFLFWEMSQSGVGARGRVGEGQDTEAKAGLWSRPVRWG